MDGRRSLTSRQRRLPLRYRSTLRCVTRWIRVTTVAGLAALMLAGMLAGCTAKPRGVDGDLTNGWPALAKAAVPTPLAGTCYAGDFVPTLGVPEIAVGCD